MQTKVKVVMQGSRVRLYSNELRMFVQGPRDDDFRLGLDNKVVRVELVTPTGKSPFLRLV